MAQVSRAGLLLYASQNLGVGPQLFRAAVVWPHLLAAAGFRWDRLRAPGLINQAIRNLVGFITI